MIFPLIRPAQISDLDTYIKFSETAAYGITSLPKSPLLLEKKLQSSIRSFSESLLAPTHEVYLFCLEIENKVVGMSGITSRIGMSEPFFAYHLLYEPHVCQKLNIATEIPVLHFIEARKKPTEIGSLFLEKSYRKKNLGKLLSFCRFLFIASFRNRFASTIIAELRGVNEEGKSPFWSAIGEHFFHIDFPKIDLLRAEHPECLQDLFPKYPIYRDMLSKEVQKIIGVTHQNTVPAQKILEKIGFKKSLYLDLLDAGPHMYAVTDEIEVVKKSRQGVVRELRSNLESETMAVIANTKLQKYRTTVSPLIIEEGDRITIPIEVGSLLQVDISDPIRYFIIG